MLGKNKSVAKLVRTGPANSFTPAQGLRQKVDLAKNGLTTIMDGVVQISTAPCRVFVTIRRALFFYSGQRGAFCQLLLPADTKTSCISILQTKAVCTACVWVQKAQLCIQQLKSGLHCKYSVVTHAAKLRPSCLGEG